MGIISTSTFSWATGGSEADTQDELTVEAGAPAPPNGPPPLPPSNSLKFFDVPNVPSQIGSTFRLRSGPIFQQAVSFLTDGQPGALWFLVNKGGLFVPKSDLKGVYPGVDLHGFTIERLNLRIDKFNTFQSADGTYWTASTITFVIRGKFPRRCVSPRLCCGGAYF
jgi:hypothetical protein